MARFLFIVARQLPNVYEHLRQQFAAEPEVQVIVDRRQGQRRQTDRRGSGNAPAPSDERRRGERRQNPGPDEQLRTMGYAFVRLPD